MSSAFLTYLKEWELHHFPQPFLMLVRFLHDKKLFLMFNLNLLQCILRPFPHVLSLVRQKWSSPHLLWWSCREWRGFLSASFSPDWTLVPSPLVTFIFWFLHQLCCPFLQTLEQLNALLLVGDPKPNTVFKVKSHQCKVHSGNHIPCPAATLCLIQVRMPWAFWPLGHTAGSVHPAASPGPSLPGRFPQAHTAAWYHYEKH